MARMTDLRNCSGCGARIRGGAIYGGPELEGHAFCDSSCKFAYVIQELTRLRTLSNSALEALQAVVDDCRESVDPHRDLLGTVAVRVTIAPETYRMVDVTLKEDEKREDACGAVFWGETGQCDLPRGHAGAHASHRRS